MNKNSERTYVGWRDFARSSSQTEHTAPTRLLDSDGRLLAAGWARENLFDYDRSLVRPRLRGKEWDFYQISDGRYMLQLSFANISVMGYVSAVLTDLRSGETPVRVMSPFFGGRDRYPLPSRGDAPNLLSYRIGGAEFRFDTRERGRTLWFKLGRVECSIQMDIPEGSQSITTVLPFEGLPTRFFMTTKQNCLPCSGTVKNGGEVYSFSKEDSFCVLDWGRVNTPYRLVWYWGNGSTYLTDSAGARHTFGFEITWGIGSEAKATETCLFYDGVAHKIGAVDVETFPKPDKYLRPWRFISEDGRFDMTMTPFLDHHNDMNLLALRMNSHQVHGLWNGTVTLDDGTRLELRDMYAFCEYVENRW